MATDYALDGKLAIVTGRCEPSSATAKRKTSASRSDVTEPDEIAAAVAFAARQDRSMVNELDLYRRGTLTGF